MVNRDNTKRGFEPNVIDLKAPDKKIIQVKGDRAIKALAEHNFPNYINSTPVVRFGDTVLYLSDVVKAAAFLARMNVGLLGDTGMGKTQLEKEMMAAVGARSNYVLGRNDLDIKQLYRQFDFGRLQDAIKSGKSVSAADISRVTEGISRPLTIVDEINRCIEAVQNQLFNIFDGYLELDGVIYPLGVGYDFQFTNAKGDSVVKHLFYSVGMCSANYGNGKFTGTSVMDRAMKDRLHAIIDVDNFSPTEADVCRIIRGGEGGVRTRDTENPKDLTDVVLEAHGHFVELSAKTHAEELLLTTYLYGGLDYIPAESAKNSKRVMKGVWPGNVEGDKNPGTNDFEKFMYAMVFPPSIRGVQSTISLARALRAYARAKDPKVDDSYKSSGRSFVLDSVMEAFRITGAYSGIVYEGPRLQEEFHGNPYLAVCQAVNFIRSRLEENYQLLQAAAYSAITGKDFTSEMNEQLTKDFECFKRMREAK